MMKETPPQGSAWPQIARETFAALEAWAEGDASRAAQHAREAHLLLEAWLREGTRPSERGVILPEVPPALVPAVRGLREALDRLSPALWEKDLPEEVEEPILALNGSLYVALGEFPF